MKLSQTILLVFALMPFCPRTSGQITYDHNVDHGSLTLLSNDGTWRRYATEFPVVGGWLASGSPTDTGNGPLGSIWVFQDGNGWGVSWGAYDAPISPLQYDNPSLIHRTWDWGIYYVYGENKVLEYGAFDYQYPPGTVSYTISYSAGVVPEPSVFALAGLGAAALAMRRRTLGS
jgi:hypothetical protein